MTETAEANGAAVEVAPTEHDCAPLSSGEKLKRLPKPDDEEYNAKFEKLNAQIMAMNTRLGEVKELLDAFHDKRKSGSSEQVELRNKINDEKARFQAVLAKKAEIKSQLERINKHRDELRGQAKSTKDKSQYMKEEDIDEKLKKLQHKLEHTSLTLNEEKQVLSQMKDLERSRGLVVQYAEQMEKMSNSNDMRESVIEELKARDNEIQEIKDRQKDLQDKLNSLRDREASHMPNIPELMAEKKECHEVIRAAKQAKSTLYHERKAALDTYYQREREVKKQIQEERKARLELRKKEWEERQKERRAREEAERGEPFEDEIILCDQLATYLSGLLPKAAAAAESSPAAPAAAPEAGMKLVKKKGEDEELEAMFAGLGSKGKGKGAKKSKKIDKKEEKDSARIQHSIDTLSSFSKLKVEVPLSTSSVPATLEALKAAKESFLEKRVAEKERQAAEPEVSTSGAAAELEAGGAYVAEKSAVCVTFVVMGDSVSVTLTVPQENGSSSPASA
mmetsp:Transcript_14269/g.40434  ORF Transcript_14269/g.40434 Transcript_14269/m.40434 type:complete len:506 (-) Transcript_14269:156-1673(-)